MNVCACVVFSSHTAPAAVMAFVTFLLVAGLGLGADDRFTPQALGVLASSTLVG